MILIIEEPEGLRCNVCDEWLTVSPETHAWMTHFDNEAFVICEEDI